VARPLVVEADGGSRGNPGPAAYGAVVRDAATGKVLAERAEHIGRATNNVAEYRGLIAGLEAAREIDADATVEARLDSKLVVEQMSGRWQIKHPDMKPLAMRAKRVLPPEQVSFTWVPREKNKAADRLANLALDAAERGEELSLAMSESPGAGVDEAELEPPRPRNVLVGWSDELATPTTLVLLRHGETPSTVRKLFSGRGGEDPSLTELGRRQAAAAAAALAARGGIDAVVSSPLRRAVETAEAAASALGLQVRVEDGFAECDFGAWDGCTLDEVRERWPDELAAWLDSTAVAPPGGESYDDHGQRVAVARDKVMTRYPGRTVLVVAHVMPVKHLIRTALGAPPYALHRMELSPASFSVVQWWPEGIATMRLFNGTEHLAGLTT
jgi:broad specificity phosphatase PhoE/ribonuclease HI